MSSKPSFEVKRWLRFLLGGVVNTAFSYAIYILLNTVLVYQIAYLVSYTLGVIFSYWFNALFVFHVSLTWKGLFLYPSVYVIQYVISAFLLSALVEYAGVMESFAPLLVSIVMVPVTYVISKFVLNSTNLVCIKPNVKM